MRDFLIPSFLMSDVSKLLRSLAKNERWEQIAQVAHQKWATVSNLLRSLTRNEQTGANHSGRSPKTVGDGPCMAFHHSVINIQHAHNGSTDCLTSHHPKENFYT